MFFFSSSPPYITFYSCLLGHIYVRLVRNICYVNWLILWQNVLYWLLGRSRMGLILQKKKCSSLVLKPCKSDQETSEGSVVH